MNQQLKMFLEYIYELRRMRNESVTDKEIYNMFEELQWEISQGFCEWIDIDGVGFIVIGRGLKCPPDYDYYIIDTYIKPENRRKGLVSKTIKKYMNEHKGKYCLEIINANKAAKCFWKSVGELHIITDWHIDDKKSTPYWMMFQ